MTKRLVTGRDGVVRPAVSLAPSFTPGTAAVAKHYRAEAARLDGTAGAFMRAEARVAGQVAGYTAPHLDPGGDLPYGPARPGLDRVEIEETGIDPATGRDRQVRRVVRRRRGPMALAILPAALKATAERYAALVEAVGASRGSSLDAPVRGGVSDGGATARCRLAQRLRRARRAIGTGLILRPQRHGGTVGRRRLPVSALELIEAVCVRGWSLEQLLKRRGWSRKRTHTKILRTALEAALERLREVV